MSYGKTGRKTEAVSASADGQRTAQADPFDGPRAGDSGLCTGGAAAVLADGGRI